MNKDEYNTFDIYLASFLIASNYSKLKDIRHNGQGRKLFVFSPEPEQEVILGFYNGCEKVSAIKLFESFQSLKAATYVLGNKNGGLREV
jgi:hypothetical protein